MKIAFFLDIIGVVKPSPSMGFRCQVSGQLSHFNY